MVLTEVQCRQAGRALVAAQLILAAGLVVTGPWRSAGPVSWWMVGMGVTLIAWAWRVMGQQLRAMPEPKANGHLKSAGPYRWLRHPMYTGGLLLCGAPLATSPTLARISAWLGLLVVLGLKAHLEEFHLRERFPDYDEYRRRTYRFVPFIY